MKKYLNLSLVFGIYGLCAGVYFREFTKFKGFEGRTMLGMAHPHILALGLAGFLLIALFVKTLNIEACKKMRVADIVYTVGLVIASVMMLVRGTMEVCGMEFTAMMNGMISGIAGIGHILTAAGIIRYLTVFKKAA